MERKKFDIVSHFKLALAAREKKNDIIIDANKMARELYMMCDLSGMTREELEQRFIAVYTRSLLWKAGYRSIFRWHGYYIHEKTLRPEMIARLFNNQKITRDVAEKILASIKKHIRMNSETLDGQLEFDWDTGKYKEAMSKDDLLENDQEGGDLMTVGDLIAYLSNWEDDTEVAFIVASPEKRVFYDTGDKFVITDVGRPVIAIDVVKESPFNEAENAAMDGYGTFRSEVIQ